MNAGRMQSLTAAILIVLGIWLTGYKSVHWLLYVPVVLLLINVLTGFCFGVWFWKKMGFKD